MKPKVAKIIFIVFFFIVLLLPILNINGALETGSLVENRRKGSLPSLFIDGKFNYKILKHFDNFMNDNIGFRDLFINLNSKLLYYVFDTSPLEKVVKGKDGWLFYDDFGDGANTMTYKGYNVLSKKDMQQITDNLIKTKKYIKDNFNGEFILYIPPNKNRVYSEYMPNSIGTPNERYKLLELIKYIRSHSDVKVVYPYEDLMNAKNKIKENIYFKTDTHWNFLGSYIGISTLLKEMGINMPDIASDDIKIINGKKTAGDLAGYLGLKKELEDNDLYYTLEGYDTNHMKIIKDEYSKNYGNCHFKCENADNRRVMMFHDSYGGYIKEYMGSQFKETLMAHQNFYSKKLLDEFKPDVFIYEKVEREVSHLLWLY